MKKHTILGVICISMILIFTFVSCNSNAKNDGFMKLVKNEAEYLVAESWTVPDFTGWSCAEVANVLDNIGQEYEITFIYDENVNVNIVTWQYPGCGETVKKHKKLQLKVNNYYAKSNTIKLQYSYMSPIAEIGKWIYFTDGTSIYRSNNNYKNCEKIYTHENPFENITSIIPRKDIIFFLVKSQNDYWLYSVDIQGKENRKIFKPEECLDIFITGDILNIFYGNLYQYDMPKNEIKNDTDLLIYSFSFIQHAGYRYYIGSKGEIGLNILVRQNIEDGSETVLFESNKQIFNLCLYNNSIYYISRKEVSNDFRYDEWLYKYDLDSKNNVEIIKITNQNVADTNQLFIWRENLIVINNERIIKVNLENQIYSEVKINSPYNLGLSHTLCGNYIYRYTSYPENGMILLGDRYNLLTDEYEEFEWKKITK